MYKLNEDSVMCYPTSVKTMCSWTVSQDDYIDEESSSVLEILKRLKQ